MRLSNLLSYLCFAVLFTASTLPLQAQFEWANKIGGTGIEKPGDIVTDDAGNTYVIGEFNSPMAEFGSTILTGPGNFELPDVFVAKYNTSGVAQWAIALQGPSNDEPVGIALDGMNNILITGTFNNSIQVGDSLFPSVNTNSRNTFIAKLDNDGNFLWQQRAYGTNSVESFDIAADASGNVYVCGTYSGDAFFGSSVFDSPGNNDVGFIAKFDANGAFQWLDRQFGTNASGFSFANEVAISPDGLQVYLAGWFNGDAIWGGLAGIPASAIGDQDNLYLARYDEAGNIKWVNRFGAYQLPTFNSTPNSNDLVVLSNGDPVLLGQFGGGIIFDDTDSVETDPSIMNGAWHYESFLAAYDSLGVAQWRSIIVGDEAEASDMALGNNDNLYLTGSVDGAIDLGNSVTGSVQAGSAFIGIFNSTGMAQSFVATDVLSEPDPMEIGVDASGNAYIAGPFFATGTFSPFDITATGTNNIYLAKTGMGTGIASPTASNQVSLYPNPTSGHITLEMSDLNEEATIRIFDISGKLMAEEMMSTSSKQLDVSTLQAGTYFLQVEDADGIALKRLVIGE